MTEKTLPFDRNIIPQETGYWCGPASIQVVLNSVGINVPEPELARKTEKLEGNDGWDDRDGTDHIRQVVTVLNEYTKAGYAFVDMQRDPPTAEQKEKLWLDLVGSINAGRGVVANIVAPPTNQPKHVFPSTIGPNYGRNTVYHYFSVMGYSDNGPRRVLIADSGFSPYWYWMSFDQLATLIPPKGYAAAPGPVPLPLPIPQQAQPAGIDAELLSAVMLRRASSARYQALAPAFNEALIAAGCTTAKRAAMFIAQIGHESDGLLYMEELWGPTEAQRRYEGRADLGNTQPGDGFRFKGRGPIQVTGRNHYANLSKWAHGRGAVPSPTFFVDNPHELASDKYGFMGAVWYWTTQRPLNALADKGDLEGATKAINGGLTNIEDRRRRYQVALSFGDKIIPATATGAPPVSPDEDTPASANASLRQLRPFVGRIRQILRPQFVNESTRTPAEPWPYDIWADVWNEVVHDGYDISPEYANVSDDVKRSLVAMVQTIAARQVRLEKKLDLLLERNGK